MRSTIQSRSFASPSAASEAKQKHRRRRHVHLKKRVVFDDTKTSSCNVCDCRIETPLCRFVVHL